MGLGKSREGSSLTARWAQAPLTWVAEEHGEEWGGEGGGQGQDWPEKLCVEAYGNGEEEWEEPITLRCGLSLDMAEAQGQERELLSVVGAEGLRGFWGAMKAGWERTL